MTCRWRPVQFRILANQLGPMLSNLEVNGRSALPTSELYWGTVEFGLIDALPAHQTLFERARALRYEIYPGYLQRQLTAATQFTSAYWEDRAAWLESMLPIMGADERRLIFDLENQAGRLVAGNFKNGDYFGSIAADGTPIGPSLGTLADLRRFMAPFLRLITVHKLIPMVHPVGPEYVVFTEIADAARGDICMQLEQTYRFASMIYTNNLIWRRLANENDTTVVAPLRRRYPNARISNGCKDTILRKYWFNRLSELASVHDGFVFIDDEFRADWGTGNVNLGNESVYLCNDPHYNMNEHVVEAYAFRGNRDHLDNTTPETQTRDNRMNVNIALGGDHNLALVRQSSTGFNHSGVRLIESDGLTRFVGAGSATGMGYQRGTLITGGSGVAKTGLRAPPFTILLDFYMDDLNGLLPSNGARKPLLSVWNVAGASRWFRVYYQPSPSQYVFEVVQMNGGPGSVTLTISAPDLTWRDRRRLQISHTATEIRMWSDQTPSVSATIGFPVGAPNEGLALNYERNPTEGPFFSSVGTAYDQLVIWDTALTRVPTGHQVSGSYRAMDYPFLEPQG